MSTFPTTHWSIVVDARGKDTGLRQEALSRLFLAYWPPLYAYARRRGNPEDQARDLMQAYFAFLIEKAVLEGVDPGTGRFRAYLLKTFQRFLANEYHRAQAAKRGGRQAHVQLDTAEAERWCVAGAATASTPDREFEQRWAATVLERAMDRLRQNAARQDRLEQFERLAPLLTDGVYGALRDAAQDLGSSETAVRVAVHRLRKRLRTALRDEIAETVADPADVDDELQFLFRALAT